MPFFHWALRFPEIRARGGFDCVIGNPPWEQYKPDQKAWFASRAPQVAALPGAKREAAIKALADSAPELHAAWRLHVKTIERLSEWARRCGRFTPTGAEANTYLLFAEHNADVLRPDGRAGVLLKSQLALDRSASAVFHRLLDTGRLEEFHDVVNGGPTGTNLIFPNVDGVERFAVVAFAGEATGEEGFDATVMNWNLEEAATRMPRRFTARDASRLLNPRTRTLTSFRRNEELEVALDIHRRLPILDFDGGGENPWEIEYCTLFHSKGDSGQVPPPRRSRGGRLDARRRQGLPARRSRSRCRCTRGSLSTATTIGPRPTRGTAGANKYGRKPGIPETTDEQKAEPDFEIEPRYWMDAGVVQRSPGGAGRRAGDVRVPVMSAPLGGTSVRRRAR